MRHTEHQIAAGEFKAKCLHIMNEVRQKHLTFTITKHGKPIAQLTPLNEKQADLFGCMQDSVKIKGDILNPIKAKWEANDE